MKICEFNTEYKELIEIFRKMDRKVMVIFLSVAVLQTISWYYASRNFFRINLFPLYQNDSDVYLYEYLYWFVSDFVTLFILSILIIKFIIKEDLKDYGLQPGDYKAGLIFSTIFLGVMISMIWFISATPDFASKYPHLQSTKDSWSDFYIYEAGMFLYMFGWEFIWRGFMLFGLKEKFGYYSVLIQMIPFVILHNGKPVLETFGAIAGGIALGMLAFRTNSFYCCVITHAGVMFTIDLISTLRYRTNDYGIGLDSLFNIIINIF
ncbi:MAG: CPBP family intramembrane metalloprotease [bacterium]|nr:CPBP family intramembrane metalloprotease [bacterium]